MSYTKPYKIGDRLGHYEVLKQLPSRKFVGSSKRVYLVKCLTCQVIFECEAQSLKAHTTHACLCSRDTIRSSNISLLLEDTPLAYYWLGYLMADGHFQKRGRLCFTLSVKDAEQVRKFAEFISFTGMFSVYKRSFGLKVMDAVRVKCVAEKFKISSRKTYEPCDLMAIKDDILFLCWLVGFIDGDGSIVRLSKRSDCQINIKLHSSWLDNLEYIRTRVESIVALPLASAKINGTGYAHLCLANHVVLIRLCQVIKEFSLPVLERKWNRSKYYAIM